jgi:outer membrane biosynthesis protein TonB
MWHLLRKKVHGIDPVARISISIAGGLHLFLLLIVVCVEWLKPVQKIEINRQLHDAATAIIIIDPTVKETKIIHSSAVPHTKQTQKTEAAAPSTSPKKAPSQKPAITMVEDKKTTAPKKTQPKAKPAAKKKPVQKKVESKKDTKKPTPKKESAKPKPVEAPKKEPEKKIEKPEPVPIQPQATQEVAQAHNVPTLPDGSSGPIIIARSAQEAAALTTHLAIQEELLRVWHPPVGVDEHAACTIRVIISTEGTIKSLEVTQPSGILLFDISARAAIQQAVWPRAVWGSALELCLQ